MCPRFTICAPPNSAVSHTTVRPLQTAADLITQYSLAYSTEASLLFSFSPSKYKYCTISPNCYCTRSDVTDEAYSVWVCECVKTNKPLCKPSCDLSLRDTRFLPSRGSCAASKPGSQWEFCAAWVQGDTLNS